MSPHISFSISTSLLRLTAMHTLLSPLVLFEIRLYAVFFAKSSIFLILSIPLPNLQSDMSIILLPLWVIASSFSTVLHGPSLYVDIFSVFTFIALIDRST